MTYYQTSTVERDSISHHQIVIYKCSGKFFANIDGIQSLDEVVFSPRLGIWVVV